jgi:glycerophosphoryl diester phosphodiesterase
MNVLRRSPEAVGRPVPVRHSDAVTDGVRPAAPRYGRTSVPLAIAHRGGAGLAPENTLAAFSRAHDLGFRYLETDVRLTADGQLVAFHDARLRRVTGQRGRLSRTRAADLVRHPVGGLGGHAIPTLEALLTSFPDSCFTVDVKDQRCIEPLADVLRRTESAYRVCVAGAWDGRLQTLVNRVGADLTAALGWRDLYSLVTCAHARISAPRRVSGTFAHVPLSVGRLPVFGERLVTRAAELGIGVVVWTVDDPAQMHRLLDAGVAGIITDRPDLLREVLVARGEWQRPDERPLQTDPAPATHSSRES